MPNKISPSAFVLIRLAFCTLLFWVVKFLFIKEKIHKKDISRLVLCGLLGAAANMMFYFHGINLTSPIDASIIMTATPVIVLIFSFFLLKEPITKNKLLGITIAGLSAVFLILYGKNARGTSSFTGNLFVFLNACCYGLYLVIAKPLMRKYKAITIVCWMFLFGFILVFPFGIGDLLSTDFSTFNTNTYLTIGYVLLFTTFFAYLLNIYALHFVSPSVNSSYIYLQPVVSFILVSVSAYIFMQSEYAQDINLIKILSCIVVASGVYIISKPEKKSI